MKKTGITPILYLMLVITCLATSSCATKKFYNGVAATDLSGLSYGISRTDVEKVTGNPKREFQCESVSSIATYIYDRGYTGCVGEGLCKPEHEKYLQASEIFMDYFTAGLFTWFLNNCINPCQEGILELSYDSENRLIGARELPNEYRLIDVLDISWTNYSVDYCWGKWNKPHEGYPCTQIYNNRRPSSVPEKLILNKDPEETCEEYFRYNTSKIYTTHRAINDDLAYLSHAEHTLSRNDLDAAYRLLEYGLISGHKVVRERARLLIKQYPEIQKWVIASFTTESLRQSMDRHGDARRIEYRRLLIYKTWAPVSDYQDAKSNYLSVFGFPPD